MASTRDVLRTAFFSLWGVTTLVLVFTVVFLFLELVEREQEIELSERAPTGSYPAARADRSEELAQVNIYFASDVSVHLEPETRGIPVGTRTVENCANAMDALIQGPQKSGLPVLPPTTSIRAMYLLNDGELVIDLSRSVENAALSSAGAEWLMAQAIAHTLTQPGLQAPDDRPVVRIRFLFEGSPAREGFPGHISLETPVRPAGAMVRPAQRTDPPDA